MFSYRQIRQWHSSSDAQASADKPKNDDTAFDRSYVRTKLENGLLRVWRVGTVQCCSLYSYINVLCICTYISYRTLNVCEHVIEIQSTSSSRVWHSQPVPDHDVKSESLPRYAASTLCSLHAMQPPRYAAG